MLLLCSFALFVALWCKGKRIPAFCFFYFAITNGFGLRAVATNFDLTYLSFAVGLFAIISYLRDKNTSIRTYSVENGVFWIFCFLGLSFYATIILGIDSPKYAFVVFRTWGLIASFLLFRNFSADELDKLLKWFLLINVVWVVLYYLQFAGLNLFAEERFKTAYKRNCPRLSMFFAIFVIFYYKGKWKWLLFFLFAFTSITSGFRTLLAGFVAAITFFYLMIRKSKIFLLVGMIVFFCSDYMINNAFKDVFNRNGDMSFFEELQNGFRTDYKHYRGILIDGTFAYRTLYLVERIDYLLSNPEYMLFGVGSIYEKSPNNHFHFYVQSSGVIETDDLFWAAPLLRYGFFGTGLYVIFFVSYYRYFRRQNLNDKMVRIGMIFFLMLLLTSLSTWSFARPENMIAMGMCYYKVRRDSENKFVESSNEKD